MWSASAERRCALVLALAAVAGCGQRQLSVSLHVDGRDCALAVPAGGSILYQVTANGSFASDAGAASFCGGCIAVDSDLGDADALVAFLQKRAPSCGGVHPETLLGLRLIAWRVPDCPASPSAFCVDGPTVLVPDGRGDAAVDMQLACHAQCATVCQPTTCAAAGKSCGPISDGCNHVIECGDCKPPTRCGGAGVANVCGR